jgi:hypothetical protein
MQMLHTCPRKTTKKLRKYRVYEKWCFSGRGIPRMSLLALETYGSTTAEPSPTNSSFALFQAFLESLAPCSALEIYATVRATIGG